MAKKVAVIGAGTSGLATIKCCLDEGLEPTCFERSDDIGGLWRYTEKVEDGRGSIYKSVITNTSKEMMCCSDFPFPEHFPNYLSHTKMLEYQRRYAEHFGLLRCIKFKTLVKNIRKRSDFSSTGQWDIVTEKEGKQESTIFDAVFVCNGHFVEPYLPLESFPGIEKFKGRWFHSREYKTPDGFQNKKVLILGIGNSAADIATELSHTASEVFLSTRRGIWVLNRIFGNGYPWDIIHLTRVKNWIRNFLPPAIKKWLEAKSFNRWFNHANYGLGMHEGDQWKEPIANEELPSRIISGCLVIKTSIREFTETSAIFDDGSVEKDIDVVILATGYSISFPFLDESVVKVVDNNISLYKSVFLPALEKPTLAFIGLILPIAALMPTAEMQARWATRVISGLKKLPPLNEIMEDIEKKKKILIKRFGTTRGCTLLVDYIEYMDEIAAEIDVKPNILHLFLTDPKLALEVFLGPCTPCQYRLTGPGKWDGARTAILTEWNRILKPTRTRVAKKLAKSSLSLPLWFLWILALFVSVLVFNFYSQTRQGKF
uniref:Flavin-containing monooxygenase n=1 Tax=Geotrypetes seraphini TaxID=260995 RepID=A0A6P8SFH6_GEOSA|nr:dimethylaniline monooxygenase [N-oxide-forming] 2-like [Geotrypetes seraphini]XP_033817194.1 dimethylaniline monooxygenase [N-oxide-forming] 2-like [Geotrypetes seraphini]XP_033817195.1 dimethylaniline monooxygenase [N-oxide-forming] 2-like [Geotrypetes seraphini]XP_033817196.1 dimethylaniline monooxygenase [N-oxide-forming] 2-like [Geotrypetes seraphini]XP_033817197.1 dimethylaniline monooxygenase [N-oxide-forming] 2-like [Geotrypetes seraphini]XP_033817198.1 dimethylaniline monooxygenase 